MKTKPRAIRNCNPGNIRHSMVKYRGEAESKDKEFKKFISMEWGFRAMFVLLHTYAKRYRLTTIPEMVARYAPPSENHTDNYTAFVCERSSTPPHATINTLCRQQMIPIVGAMAQMESGSKPQPSELEQGWTLFETHKP